MSEKDDCAAKLKKGEVVFGMIFPANYEPSEVVKPGEESFDFPALAVAAQPTTIVEGGLGSSATVRRDQKDFLFEQLLAQRIAIVCFIGNNAQRLFWHEQLAQSGFHQLHFGGRSSFCVRAPLLPGLTNPLAQGIRGAEGNIVPQQLWSCSQAVEQIESQAAQAGNHHERLSRGISTCRFLRLCWRAPLILITCAGIWTRNVEPFSQA